ncbi:MAG: SPFH domain-containing protein [Candidatus Komeilibacteria bacterium]
MLESNKWVKPTVITFAIFIALVLLSFAPTWVVVTLSVILGLIILLGFLYLAICFVETPRDRVRLVVRKGSPLHVQRPGWGFIWAPFDNYYDYTKELVRLDFEEEKVFTKGTETVDENVAFVDSVIYFYLVKDREDADGEESGTAEKYLFKQVVLLWEHGLRPSAGSMISDGSVLKDIVEPFVQAKQRDVGEDLTWRDLLYKKTFVNKLTKALNSDDSNKNPLERLGLAGDSNIIYAVKKIRFSEEMEDSLNALAIARQEGEAEKKRAEDNAVAREKVLKVINDNPQAATIIAVEKTKNHFVFTEGKNGAIPVLMGGEVS